MSTARPSSVTKTFSGLRSRCTTLLAWSAARPSHTSRSRESIPQRAARSAGSAGVPGASSTRRGACGPGGAVHREPRRRLVHAVVEHAHHARVRHEAQRVDLTPEVREVRPRRGAHGLERDGDTVGIAGAVHDAHPPATDLVFERVVTDLHARDEAHGRDSTPEP